MGGSAMMTLLLSAALDSLYHLCRHGRVPGSAENTFSAESRALRPSGMAQGMSALRVRLAIVRSGIGSAKSWTAIFPFALILY
jgi:hypothetical protein